MNPVAMTLGLLITLCLTPIAGLLRTFSDGPFIGRLRLATRSPRYRLVSPSSPFNSKTSAKFEYAVRYDPTVDPSKLLKTRNWGQAFDSCDSRSFAGTLPAVKSESQKSQAYPDFVTPHFMETALPSLRSAFAFCGFVPRRQMSQRRTANLRSH